MRLRILMMVGILITSCRESQPTSSQVNTGTTEKMDDAIIEKNYNKYGEDTVASKTSKMVLKKDANAKLPPNKEVPSPQKKEDRKEQDVNTDTKVIAEDRPVKLPVKEPVPPSIPLPESLEKKKEEPSASLPDFHEHQLWNELLQNHVSNTGLVDYKAISSDPKLGIYLKDLASHVPDASWSSKQKLAYWINAYNAFTIKRIVDHMPIKSILNLDGGKTWDVKWIKIGDKSYSLNYIENEVLRPIFKEPKIHFAINCAAKSCPPLSNSAFTSDNVLIKLEKQTKAFMNNKNYNSISAKEAKISKIFDWYAADFGDLQSFINQYSNVKTTSKPLFMDYDWSLNDH